MLLKCLFIVRIQTVPAVSHKFCWFIPYTQVEGSYDDDDDEALIAQFQEMMHKIDISC